jgi:hypothetical protein
MRSSTERKPLGTIQFVATQMLRRHWPCHSCPTPQDAKCGNSNDNAFRLRKLFLALDSSRSGLVHFEDLRQMCESFGMQLDDDSLLALFHVSGGVHRAREEVEGRNRMLQPRMRYAIESMSVRAGV